MGFALAKPHARLLFRFRSGFVEGVVKHENADGARQVAGAGSVNLGDQSVQGNAAGLGDFFESPPERMFKRYASLMAGDEDGPLADEAFALDLAFTLGRHGPVLGIRRRSRFLYRR